MPWLTDLDDACRKSGLKVTEVAGWRTRGHGPMAAVRGIICHHTAGARTGNYPSLRVVRDGRPGLDGPLAQLGLARDGSVLVIAAGKAWHAGAGSWSGLTGNSDCIGIEAESVGDGKDWTAAQRDAYPRLCRALAQHYGVPASRVIAHREWAPSRKIDPAGIDMNALRRAVSATTAASRIPDLEDEVTDDDIKKIVNGILNGPTSAPDKRSLTNLVLDIKGRTDPYLDAPISAVGAALGRLTVTADVDAKAVAAEIAKALPTTTAKQVADELYRRLGE